MSYLAKALADLVFASEMMKSELSMSSGGVNESLQRIIDDLDSTIESFEEYLRDKDEY